jgi:type IV fimbrial biogenesis protein FimT
LTQAKVPSGISITGNRTAAETPAYIMFDASGYSKTKAGAFGALTISFVRTDLAAADQYRQTRKIKIASTGRVRMCTPESDTDDNC